MVPKANEGAGISECLITAHNTSKDEEFGGSVMV
jgi:hypothetical protein